MLLTTALSQYSLAKLAVVVATIAHAANAVGASEEAQGLMLLQINAWFIANRNPKTGEYPDLPEPEAGGSKVILNPPLPTLEELLADEAAAGGKDGKGKSAAAKPAAKDGGKGAKDGKKGSKGEILRHGHTVYLNCAEAPGMDVR